MSRTTNMRPQAQRARSYSFAQNGRQSRGASMGNHILRKNSGCEIWKPSWKGTTTTFRAYPALAPENPAIFDPWRFTSDPDDYGEWIRNYPAVTNFGDPGVSFILYDPTDQGYDPQTNPCWILYNAITRAINAGQGDIRWVPWTKGSTGKGAVLARPKDVTLIQGAMYQHNGKVYDPPRGSAAEDLPVVMSLSGSAASAMLEAMNEPNPDFRGDPDDFRNMYMFGDPLALDQGVYINWYQLGKDPRQAQVAANQPRQNTFGQSRQSDGDGGQRDMSDTGYGCFLTLDHGGVPANLDFAEDIVRSKWRPWDDIIQILTVEEQIRLLSGAFPPDMILYAFDTHYRDLVPESVHNSYRAQSRGQGVAVPGQQAAPVQQQAPAGRGGFGGRAAVPAAATVQQYAEELPPGHDPHYVTPDQPFDGGYDQPAGGEEYLGYEEPPAAPPPPVAPVRQAPPAAARQPQAARPIQQAPAQPARPVQPAAPARPAPTPVAGQRRGFGGQSAASGQPVFGETLPTGELPDNRPAAAARPVQATPPARPAAPPQAGPVNAQRQRASGRSFDPPPAGPAPVSAGPEAPVGPNVPQTVTDQIHSARLRVQAKQAAQQAAQQRPAQ